MSKIEQTELEPLPRANYRESGPDFSVYTIHPGGVVYEWRRRRPGSRWLPINPKSNLPFDPETPHSHPPELNYPDVLGRRWDTLWRRHTLYRRLSTAQDQPVPESAGSEHSGAGQRPVDKPGEWLRLMSTLSIKRGDQLWSQEPGQEHVMRWRALSDARSIWGAELSAQQAAVTVATTTGSSTPSSSIEIWLDTGAITVFRPDVTEWRVKEAT